jgi:regulator of replication initiation timing
VNDHRYGPPAGYDEDRLIIPHYEHMEDARAKIEELVEEVYRLRRANRRLRAKAAAPDLEAKIEDLDEEVCRLRRDNRRLRTKVATPTSETGAPLFPEEASKALDRELEAKFGPRKKMPGYFPPPGLKIHDGGAAAKPEEEDDD